MTEEMSDTMREHLKHTQESLPEKKTRAKRKPKAQVAPAVEEVKEAPATETVKTEPETAKPTNDEKRSLSDTRLSYSSYQTLKNCEQKYYHYKVANTPHDSDYEDDSASLIIGKAFHSLLEGIEHDPDVGIEKITNVIKLVQESSNLPNDDMALVIAMAKKYLILKRTKMAHLKVVGIEVAISDDNFLGYVDVVYSDANGNWYIGDLKTTGRHSDTLEAKLEMDAQLNLYSFYKSQIAQKLNLDVDKFKSALYITTNKTTTKRKATEKLSEYVNRLMDSINTRAYVVPISQSNMDWVKTDFDLWNSRAKGLREGSFPDRNYSYCETYFRPCPYWSNCHGRNYTERKLEIWATE